MATDKGTPARAVGGPRDHDDEHEETGQFTSIFVAEGMSHLQRRDKSGRQFQIRPVSAGTSGARDCR
jgi:hypothetical protein